MSEALRNGCLAMLDFFCRLIDHELCSQYKNTRSPEVPRSPLPSPNLLGGSLAHQIVFGKVSRRA